MNLLQACCDSRKLLNEILSCIQDAIIVTDIEGRILFSSSVVEKVLGYTVDELEARNLSMIFTPEDLRYLYPNLLNMAQKNMPFEGELMLFRKGESRFFAFIVFRSYFDPIQNRTIITVCIRDIDRVKQLEKVFRESHYEDLVQIANGIAHEIRNPLMGIGGFISRFFKPGKTIQDHEKYRDYIIKNLKKIEDLVKKVEFFASLPQPCLAEGPVSKILENSVKPFAQRMRKNHIELSIRMEEMTLLFDKDLLTRVFTILIANALDALSEGGKIMIHNETGDDFAKIYVSDTGAGISPDDMPHIFNPFFSTKPDGAGIDLATAKRIMDGHGGRIEVTSIEGKGTTFTLLFPLERRQSLRICSFQGQSAA